MPPVPPLYPAPEEPKNRWGEIDEYPRPGMVAVRHAIEEARGTGYMFGKNFWSMQEAIEFAERKREAGLRADVLVQSGAHRWLYVDYKSLEGRSVPDRALEESYAAALADDRRTLPPEAPFQNRVADQLRHICDEVRDYSDLTERRDRFLEEALELGQSLDMTEDEAMQLVRYVFSRPAGAVRQEFGGVMTTLAGLAQFALVDMAECGEAELERCWQAEVIEKIRGKRSRRHGRGPLPGTTEGRGTPKASPPSPSGSRPPLTLPHPLQGGRDYPATVVLRDLAGQEACDGEPYDTMQLMADQIERMEGLGDYSAVSSHDPSPEVLQVLRDARGFVAALRGTDHELFGRLDRLIPAPHGSAPGSAEPQRDPPAPEALGQPWDPAKVRAMESVLTETQIREHLRGLGWSVAVHNDYRLSGLEHTFWLMTHPSGVWVKGEGRSDREALLGVLYPVLDRAWADRFAGEAGPSYSSWLAQTLPENLPFPGVSFGQGVTLQTVVSAARRWKGQLDAALAAGAPAGNADLVSVSVAEGWHELSEREIVRRTRAEAGVPGCLGGGIDVAGWRAACDTILSRLPPKGARRPWPVGYQETFDAISDAVKGVEGRSVEISVDGFVASLARRGYFLGKSKR